MFVLNCKVLGQTVSEKSDENFHMHYIGVSVRKRERINKGTDKHYVADHFIHSTTFHT